MGHFRLPFQKEPKVVSPTVKKKGSLGAKILFFIVLVILILAVVTQFSK